MAAGFRSISNTTYASRTNTTVTAPTGIVDGDILLYALFIGRGGGTPLTATAPSGFADVPGGTFPIALIDGASFSANCYVWYKAASGESGNYTATHTTGSSQGVMLAISGGTGTPASTSNNGTGSTATALGLTTSGNDALITFIGWDWGDTANNLTPPSGSTPTFTEQLDVVLTYVATGVLASAGATGNKTMTNNSATGKPWGAVLVAVEASGGGGASLVHRNLLLGVGT